MPKPKYNAYAEGHRSGLEDAFRDLCDKEGLHVEYEANSLPFTTPPQKRRYHPDWKVSDKCYLETKGKFTAQDRKKAVLVKEQHPDVRILYVFQRSKNTLSKSSKTTYGDWCDKAGIEWCTFSDTTYWQDYIRTNGSSEGTKLESKPKAVRSVSTKKAATVGTT
ncbi:endonuclease I [uncultured Caudovirales phage]|uniref:Endonuclease I n=1 Tax=uncultured Caudovirales phage TaxID=2100421 RepID=A0A6J5SQE3_9CAUD|nr:endonuclease I [uncultured Caudovirales phage]